MAEEGLMKAVSTCKFLDLDGIVTIGGDGTFRGANALTQKGINVIYITATIDNGIRCTNYSIGFDTAANRQSYVLTACVKQCSTTSIVPL